METVPVLMLRGHAINMSWKTQLYFSRCWNYTMYSGLLTMYPIFIKWHLEWFPLDRIRLPYQFRSIIVCWVTSLQKICVHHISLASKIYRAPAAIDQKTLFYFRHTHLLYMNRLSWWYFGFYCFLEENSVIKVDVKLWAALGFVYNFFFWERNPFINNLLKQWVNLFESREISIFKTSHQFTSTWWYIFFLLPLP